MASHQENSTDLGQKSRNVRLITTHDSNGLAVFCNTLPAVAQGRSVTEGNVHLSLLYTNELKPNMSDETDIAKYTGYLQHPPGLTIANGTVCRYCDFAPNHLTPMHRTRSLDFGVVLEGEMELVLDSGEKRHLRCGDVAVQRGTNHAWRNVTPDEIVGGLVVQKWARMLFVLQAAEPVALSDGINLSEDEGGIDRGDQ